LRWTRYTDRSSGSDLDIGSVRDRVMLDGDRRWSSAGERRRGKRRRNPSIGVIDGGRIWGSRRRRRRPQHHELRPMCSRAEDDARVAEYGRGRRTTVRSDAHAPPSAEPSGVSPYRWRGRLGRVRHFAGCAGCAGHLRARPNNRFSLPVLMRSAQRIFMAQVCGAA
jgi:hypothetical protein